MSIFFSVKHAYYNFLGFLLICCALFPVCILWRWLAAFACMLIRNRWWLAQYYRLLLRPLMFCERVLQKFHCLSPHLIGVHSRGRGDIICISFCAVLFLVFFLLFLFCIILLFFFFLLTFNFFTACDYVIVFLGILMCLGMGRRCCLIEIWKGEIFSER